MVVLHKETWVAKYLDTLLEEVRDQKLRQVCDGYVCVVGSKGLSEIFGIKSSFLFSQLHHLHNNIPPSNITF